MYKRSFIHFLFFSYISICWEIYQTNITFGQYNIYDFWNLTFFFFFVTVLNSLHINCGGARETSSEGIIYDGDSDSLGPSTSKEVGENWAISNTGHFLNSNASETYIQQNTTRLSMPDNALYKTARVSPISLTYYGFCLENGDYTVTLHFAEIAFTDDDTYKSLGRRIFDIYIQVLYG